MQRNLCDSCGSVFYHFLVHSYHEFEEREFYDLTHISYIKTPIFQKHLSIVVHCVYIGMTERYDHAIFWSELYRIKYNIYIQVCIYFIPVIVWSMWSFDTDKSTFINNE